MEFYNPPFLSLFQLHLATDHFQGAMTLSIKPISIMAFGIMGLNATLIIMIFSITKFSLMSLIQYST